MNKTGLILINGREETLAYGTSVRQEKKSSLSFPSSLNNKLISRTFLIQFKKKLTEFIEDNTNIYNTKLLSLDAP